MPEEPKARPAPAIVREITIPNHYFNGFEIGNSLSDMSAILFLEGVPQARLAMSFTTAKTLAENLSAAVRSFEETTKHNIMTMDDVRRGLESRNADQK